MKRERNRLSGLAVASLALLAVPGHHAAVSAATPDTSAWVCASCPFQTGYRADYSVGVTGVSDASAHLGSATGYDENGLYLNVDGQGVYARDDYRMQWGIEDLGLDSRALELQGGQPGLYDYRVAWRELPYRQFDTTRTPYRGAGDGQLVLPSGWVPGVSTAGLPSLGAALSQQNIGSDRETVELGGRVAPLAGIELFGDYRLEQNEGYDLSSGAYFTSAVQMARPFDYETREVDLGARYHVDRGFVELAWYGSFFEPGTSGFAWDNPYVSVAGAETSLRAEPPKNSFRQVRLSGNYRFDTWASVAGFTAAFGRLKQDEGLLAYTVNPNVATEPLPRSSFDGEVDTTNVSVTFAARPHPRARVRLAYRYDERDNGSPVESWSRVIVDSFQSGEVETNSPYSFERSHWTLRADLDPLDGLQLSGGYSYSELDRTLQEVTNQDEDTAWGGLRWRPGPFVDIRLRAGNAKREVNGYDTDLATLLGQNPLLRKYHLAHRYREFGEVTMVATHPEWPLSATFTAMSSDDEYTRSRLGLLGGDELATSVSLDWAFRDKASVYLLGSHEQIDATQAGSQVFGEPDWLARNEDEFYTMGAGLRLSDVDDRFDIGFDYTRTRGAGSIHIDSGAGVFPDLESALDRFRLTVDYRHSERLEAALTVRFDSFNGEDWALEGVGPDTIPTVLALGAEPYDYQALLVSLGFRYYLGGRTLAAVP